MRLIDADVLIENRVENDPVRIAAMCAPTAYSIDKVIARMEGRRDEAVRNIELNSQADDLHEEMRCTENFYNSIIEMVKDGIESKE